MRKEIERYPVPDGREGQKGDWGPMERSHDDKSNPSGHEVYSPSPCDSDPMSQYTVPDCSYKGYDTFTWPEGKADPCDLPHSLKHLNMPEEEEYGEHRTRQTDDYEDIEPNKR